MGGKGSGKTYTYLQLAVLKQWSKLIKKVSTQKKDADYGFIWPLLASKNLEENGKTILSNCRQYSKEESQRKISWWGKTISSK